MPESTGDELFWRETYFIVFPRDRQPSLQAVQRALAKADNRLQLENPAGDDQGRFASLFVESPEDHAAVEISFETGEAIVEQNLEWAKRLQKNLPARQLQLLMTSDSRIDVAHFERVKAGGKAPQADEPFDPGDMWDDSGDGDDGDDGEFAEPPVEMLDPTCLLTVVETLAGLTKGITIDAAAGEVL
ncbi:MAG: hypothetical protein KDA44_22550 [Planctomycetales bacterium]|nr:hypothetical protein [Planctomycetales bacterium]